jgi:hypothetical protein
MISNLNLNVISYIFCNASNVLTPLSNIKIHITVHINSNVIISISVWILKSNFILFLNSEFCPASFPPARSNKRHTRSRNSYKRTGCRSLLCEMIRDPGCYRLSSSVGHMYVCACVVFPPIAPRVTLWCTEMQDTCVALVLYLRLPCIEAHSFIILPGNTFF